MMMVVQLVETINIIVDGVNETSLIYGDEMLAEKTSISQSEFYNAQQNDMELTCKFILSKYDYNYCTQLFEKCSKSKFAITRTYFIEDKVELTCSNLSDFDGI